MSVVPPEIWILASFVFLALVVGIPSIKGSVFLPAEVEIEQVPDAALDAAQLRHFGAVDADAAAFQYRPAFNFRVTNLQGPNINRLYLNSAEPTLLLSSVAKAAPAPGDRQPRAGASYLEWISRFDDATELTTRNVGVSSVFPRMPQQRVQNLPGAALAVLKRRHDRALEALRTTRSPTFPREGDVLDRYRDYHRRFCAFQAQRGYLRLEASTGRYRATERAALRGIWNFVNPLADNFTLGRFLAGLVFGVALPAATALSLGVSSTAARTAAEAIGVSPAFVALTLQFLAFTLAGLAVGYIFQAKCYVWGLIFGYLPLRALGAASVVTVVLALWLGTVADWTARRRLLRENVA